MKRYCFLLVGLLVIGTICSGQQAEALKKTMHQYLKPEGRNPVHSMQIYLSNPEYSFCDAVGFSDGKSIPAEKDNLFKIASISKMMTATVILQMQEEGILNIGDQASRYLEDVPYVRVNDLSYFKGKPYGNSITIKQLLQHKSGLADIFTDASFRFYINEFIHKQQEWDPERLMKRYYKYRLHKDAHFVPDSGYYYSDVNFFLLGLIVEKVAQQTLAQQFRVRIFEPLSMKNSYFEYFEPPAGNEKMAHSFFGKIDITKRLNTSYDWAGGGVVSTTTDLALFLNGLFEGKLFKSAKTLEKMTSTISHTSGTGRVGYYGLGLFQYNFNGDTYFGHAGFWGSLIAYCPAKKITFCGSINQVKPIFDTREFIALLLKMFEEGNHKK
ncbi:MAG: serine hydrolase [Bacteroidia bacterium]|nr:serine hydrolase [Bacteroidia bacterium]